MSKGLADSVTNNEFVSFNKMFLNSVVMTPDKVAIRYLNAGKGPEEQSYTELDAAIRAAAGTIRQYCHSGERAVILLPAGVEFVKWFVGCFYCGVVATPTAVPIQRREWERLVNVLEDSQPAMLITNTDTLKKIGATEIVHSILEKNIKIVEIENHFGDPMENAVDLTPDMLAFLQYTSGSTGNPKGVMVTHGNLVHNEEIIRSGLRSASGSVFVSWLPLFHDMGLIGQMLQSLYVGGTLCLMSPETFLRDPLCWLEAISRYGGTIAGGPNFTYELCVRKGLASVDRIKKLNLSNWRVAFNGAEPVRAETLERFNDLFSLVGFRKDSFYPCYGLAEGTLMVSGARKAEEPHVLRLSSDHLQKGIVKISSVDDAKTMVGSGVALGEQRVLIVDPESAVPCATNQVGEIWVQGGSVGQGYWNNPVATKECFGAYTSRGEGPFLRTGDLGFFHEKNLFISSRFKDLVVINGKNFYPQDIERSAESAHPCMRLGCSAAFGVEVDNVEQLVVLCEIDTNKVTSVEYELLMVAIRKMVFSQQNINVSHVAICAPQTLFKTSSGKIQRRQCKQAFMEGKLKTLAGWSAARAEKNADKDGLSERYAFSEKSGPAVLRAKPAIKLWLRNYFMQQLGLSARQINDRVAFSDFGLDSAQAVELCEAMSEWIGFDVPASQLWDSPTIDELSSVLHENAKSLTPANVQASEVRA